MPRSLGGKTADRVVKSRRRHVALGTRCDEKRREFSTEYTARGLTEGITERLVAEDLSAAECARDQCRAISTGCSKER